MGQLQDLGVQENFSEAANQSGLEFLCGINWSYTSRLIACSKLQSTYGMTI